MNDVSFLELMSRYAADKHLRPKSVSTYTAVVRLFRRYLGHEAYPSMVTRQMVIDWRVSIIRTRDKPDGITESSWNNYVRHLKALYNFGIKHQLIACHKNPFLDVSVKQPKVPKRSLQPLQIRYAREVLEVCRRYEYCYDERSKIHPAWFWQSLMPHPPPDDESALCVRAGLETVRALADGRAWVCAQRGLGGGAARQALAAADGDGNFRRQFSALRRVLRDVHE